MNKHDLQAAYKRAHGDASQYRVVIGGPAYGGKVSAKHCGTIAYLACAFQAAGWRQSIRHRHSSILVENRDSMLRDCIERNIDIFVSIDADTYLLEESILKSSAAIVAYARDLVENEAVSDVYAVCAPVIQRDGKWNVTVNNKNIDSLPLEPIEITNSENNSWCAFAFAIHRVASYWEWSQERQPFYHFGYAPDRPPGDRWVGEDSYHSIMVNKRGGKLIVTPRILTGHDV